MHGSEFILSVVKKLKRKRLDRDGWKIYNKIENTEYYQMRVDTDGFHGLVCYIKWLDGKTHYWDRPNVYRHGKLAVIGKGMTWLQLIPDGKSHVLTAKYLPDKTVSIWYADIIENIEYDTNGVAVFIDKYLDVTFTPQGDVSVDDRHELDEALQSGDVSKEQYESALREGDIILEEYCSDISKTEVWCNKILSHVNDRIINGEKQFKKQALCSDSKLLKIYLDNCCYNRPFDDFTIGKNALEANAKIYIQSLVKYKSVALYYSFMSQIEIADSPYEERKKYILDFVETNAVGFVGKKRFEEIETLSEEIIQTGVKKKDATHLACSIISGCDYFITTDKRVLNYKTEKIKIINPINFMEIWEEMK
jgi:predicted RNA-binding protein associated with RNAse of E/G family/predicted nucleic acid-binding protein